MFIAKYVVKYVMTRKKKLQSNKKGNDIFVVDQSHKSYIVITHKVKTGKSTKKVSEQRLSIQATRKLVELLAKTNAMQGLATTEKSQVVATEVAHPTFFQIQQLLMTPALPEPPKVMSQLEKKLETCKNIYQLLKTGFPDLPKYKPHKLVINHHEEKIIHHRNGTTTRKQLGNCSSGMKGNLAHAHGRHGKYKNQICFNPQWLIKLPFVTKTRHVANRWNCNEGRIFNRFDDVYDEQCLVELVGHETAHFMVNNGCNFHKSHNKSFRTRNRRHQEFLRKCELDGRLAQCEVL